MSPRLLPAFLCLLGLGISSARLQAQTLIRYWDTNGITAGAGITPNGTWDGSITNWSTVLAGTATTTIWSSGADAVFSAGTDATGAYTITVSGTQSIGNLTFEEGTPTITGGNLSFTATSSFNVASTATIASGLTGTGGLLNKTGSGTLTLSGVNTYTGGTTVVAGTLNLTGSVSHTSSDTLVNSTVGPVLNVTGGGDLVTNRLRIGITGSTYTGAVVVDGTGSTVTNSTYLYVGEAGTGTLTISNGGTVTSVDTSIGNNSGGQGTVTVADSGSSLVNSGTLYVGSAGDGTLNIQTGGTVTNAAAVVGNNVSGAGGLVAVVDVDSTWTTTGALTVGAASEGFVSAYNSGAISAASATLGAQAGIYGDLAVYSSGSFATSGNLVIGHNGYGSLSINAGFVATGGQAILGNNAGSTGSVYLDNAGSLWTVVGDLYIGNAGTGYMRTIGSSVLNVGGVTGTGTIHLGHTGGVGSLHIGYDGEGYNPGGVINAASITTGTGTGTVLLGTSTAPGIPYYLTKDGTSSGTFVTIDGTTQVQQVAGFNVLGGASTYSGGTVISGGTLVAATSGALGTGTVQLNGGQLSLSPGVTVSNALAFTVGGGTISGNGTFGSTLTVGTNAHVSPGKSVGTLNFAGGLTLASGGTIDFEVQTAGGAPGTGYDLLSISGSALNITSTSASPFTLRLISLNGLGALGNVSDFSSGNTYAWTIASSAAGISGFSADKFVVTTPNFTNSLGIGSFFVTQSGNDLILNFTPVPEPSTYALLATGVALAGLSYRRRKNLPR
ncbi:MAG TPA: autotransporter-associated beta strand repeat-containing protein [Lacunisphaera sp.]